MRIRGAAGTFGANFYFLWWGLPQRELRTESQALLIQCLIILYIAVCNRVALPRNGGHTNEGPQMALFDTSHVQHQAHSSTTQVEATIAAAMDSPCISLTICAAAGWWTYGLGRNSRVNFGCLRNDAYACSPLWQSPNWGANQWQRKIVYNNDYFAAKSVLQQMQFEGCDSPSGMPYVVCSRL